MSKLKFKISVVAIIAVLAEVMMPTFVQNAYAAAQQFDQLYVRPDTHKASAADGSADVLTGVLVCATPGSASSATEATVSITFPTRISGYDFAVDATAANWTFDFTGIPAPNQWPLTGTTATGVSGKTVTFGTGDLTPGTMYCFHTANKLRMSEASGTADFSTALPASVVTRDSTPTDINQTNWATAVIPDNSIIVTATVPPNFTLTLSGNTDTLGNLDPLQIKSSGGRAVGISTNAPGGWIAWVKDTSFKGLHSTDAGYTIESGLKNGALVQQHSPGDPAFDLATNQEGYVLDVDGTPNPTGCYLNLDPAYDSSTGNGGGMLDSAFRPIAACNSINQTAGAPYTSDLDTLTLYERASIRGGTPAGTDYTDTIFVVGAGNF